MVCDDVAITGSFGEDAHHDQETGCIPVRPPHFDLHQSGTIFNLGAMGCMFDN
jgi:hypothetical protein